MLIIDPFITYCHKVCALVRWRPYHDAITAELTAHMEDHADILVAKGADPEDARRAAVEAMGDPYALGKALDALHSPWYPRLSRVFAILAVLILCVTTLMGFAQDSTLFARRFAPFADPAKLVLQTDDLYAIDPPTPLAAGGAVGGGKLGVYAFSPTGAAVLFRRGDVYEGEDTVSYRLDVVFSSTTPWFWLDEFIGDDSPKYLRVGNGPLQEVGAVLFDMAEQGIFRRFYRFSAYLESPVSGPCTIEVGENHELIYSFTLEEVDAP